MSSVMEGKGEDSGVTLKDLSKKLQDFAKARDGEKYHTPRNLLLAMVLIHLFMFFLLTFFLLTEGRFYLFDD